MIETNTARARRASEIVRRKPERSTSCAHAIIGRGHTGDVAQCIKCGEWLVLDRSAS